MTDQERIAELETLVASLVEALEKIRHENDDPRIAWLATGALKLAEAKETASTNLR